MIIQQYLDVISDGPLMIVRMPYVRLERRDGTVSERPSMRWRDVLKAITVVMRSHGFKLKNVYAIERKGPAASSPKFEAEWEQERGRLEVAFDGDPTIFPDFWLYEWKNGAFALVRRGTQAVERVGGPS